MSDMMKFYTEWEIKAGKEERTIDFIASKEIVDRDSDVIRVAGINLKHYKTNPVVLWAHSYNQPPIAKAERVWKSQDGTLRFKAKFPEMEVYSFADTIYKLLKGNYINAVSIGFIPNRDKIEYVEPKKGKGASRIYNEVELLEISVVPVPSNPEALVQSKGITKAMADRVIDELELQELKDYCPECNCKEEKDIEGIVEKPYENEHSCRLQDPKKYKKFRRVNNAAKIDGKSVDHIFGILSPKKSELQAIRFPVKNWTAAQAKKHCEGTFEAAKKAVKGTNEAAGETFVIDKKPVAEQDYIYLLHHLHPPKKAEDMEEVHHCPLFEKKGMEGEEYAQIHVKDKKVIWHALDVEEDALKGVSKAVYCHLDNAYKIKKKKIGNRRWAIVSGMVDLDDTTWSEQDKEIEELREEIKMLKDESYLYRLFDGYKKESETKEDKYRQILDKLKQ